MISIYTKRRQTLSSNDCICIYSLLSSGYARQSNCHIISILRLLKMSLLIFLSCFFLLLFFLTYSSSISFIAMLLVFFSCHHDRFSFIFNELDIFTKYIFELEGNGWEIQDDSSITKNNYNQSLLSIAMCIHPNRYN